MRKNDKSREKRFGFWQNDNIWDTENRKSEVLANQAHGWNRTEEAKACIAFMKAGEVIARYRGFALDRVDGETIIGSCDLQNEDWIFPQGWERYITEYSIKPPEDFIRDAVAWYTKSPQG